MLALAARDGGFGARSRKIARFDSELRLQKIKIINRRKTKKPLLGEWLCALMRWVLPRKKFEFAHQLVDFAAYFGLHFGVVDVGDNFVNPGYNLLNLSFF